MRLFLSAVVLASLAGCCSGTPATLAEGRPTAVSAQTSVGFVPEVRAAVMIPPDMLACFVAGANNVLVDVVNTIKCAAATLTPIVVKAPAAPAAPAAPLPCVPASNPSAVPPPKASPCASGACAVR